MSNEVYQRRVESNETEIINSKKRRIKYRIIECSIAVTALFSSSCAYACYRKAPVDGAIFYTTPPSEIQIITDAYDYYFDGPVELPEKRYITETGINKKYYFGGNNNFGVSLLTVARGLDTNYMTLNQKVELDDGNYVYVKTVPTKKEKIKYFGIIASSIIATLGSVALFKKKDSDEEEYERSLGRKNRRLKKLLHN